MEEWNWDTRPFWGLIAGYAYHAFMMYMSFYVFDETALSQATQILNHHALSLRELALDTAI
jgi:hypothetical protein